MVTTLREEENNWSQARKVSKRPLTTGFRQSRWHQGKECPSLLRERTPRRQRTRGAQRTRAATWSACHAVVFHQGTSRYARDKWMVRLCSVLCTRREQQQTHARVCLSVCLFVCFCVCVCVCVCAHAYMPLKDDGSHANCIHHEGKEPKKGQDPGRQHILLALKHNQHH